MDPETLREAVERTLQTVLPALKVEISEIPALEKVSSSAFHHIQATIRFAAGVPIYDLIDLDDYSIEELAVMLADGILAGAILAADELSPRVEV